MEREPTLITEHLAIAFEGKMHRGQRVVLVVSDTEIRQEVRYKSLRQVDPEPYRSQETDFMRAVAREMLWRLVREWKAGGVAKPAKVEPEGGPRELVRRRETPAGKPPGPSVPS